MTRLAYWQLRGTCLFRSEVLIHGTVQDVLLASEARSMASLQVPPLLNGSKGTSWGQPGSATMLTIGFGVKGDEASPLQLINVGHI